MKGIGRILTRAMKLAIPRWLLIVRGSTDSHSIALTYDDGPHPTHTHELLDILGRECVRATFFLNGEPGSRFPELVQRIAREGHELGNHLYSHKHIEGMTYREFSFEVEETARLIASLTGRIPGLVRPPYGKITSRALWYALHHKTPLVLWSVDTLDSGGNDLHAIQARMERHILRPGDIVLMHEDYSHIVELTQFILAQGRRFGMGFATVSELTTSPTR